MNTRRRLPIGAGHSGQHYERLLLKVAADGMLRNGLSES